jgi:GTPase SAR1 family protein
MQPDANFAVARTSSGEGVVFSPEERERHVFLIGKSGSGKSTLLYNLILGDIHTGKGVAVIDPHGDLAEAVLDAVPRSRINDVCYLNVADTERPVGFNPVACIPAERRALAAAGIVEAFKHLWAESWGARLEHFLFHGVMVILARERGTLLDLPRLYTDERFRDRVVAKLTDTASIDFWGREYPGYPASYRSEAAAPILNKAGRFNASPHLRSILGQIAPRLDLGFTMNRRRILIANLAKGVIGEHAANLLGSLLVSNLQLVAMARASLPESERVPFYAHIDEFQTFSSEVFAPLLSEARKFALHFCLANQFMDQLPAAVRAAVIGNVGTMIAFRVGGRDAELLAPEFRPIEEGALTDQRPFTAWLRRGSGLHRIFPQQKIFEPLATRDAIITQSRQRFGRSRSSIER